MNASWLKSDAVITVKPMRQLLTTAQMYEADRLTIEGGTPGIALMENAGQAIARIAVEQWPEMQQVTVLCGPGNNGGDGYIAARILAEQGRAVRVLALMPDGGLKGDAAIAAGRYDGPVENLTGEHLHQDGDYIIDVLFGAGLTRNIKGELEQIIARINDRDVRVLAVDVPSGIDGNTGAVCGCAVRAEITVTFFRRKPGHLLLPGRVFCGSVLVEQIGISDRVLDTIEPTIFANEPTLWQRHLPVNDIYNHKYTRGHALVVSGGSGYTGAARLAARAALRAGAGLVTVASPADALLENACQLTSIMVREVSSPAGLADFLGDKRIRSCVIGPSLGFGLEQLQSVIKTLKAGCHVVLDADGLMNFVEADCPDHLFEIIAHQPERNVVLTPHVGEFNRLFADMEPGAAKIDQARLAAQTSNAIIVYKGPDTVIAESQQSGFCAINANATPNLATAGSGDVLAGIISGLQAQGMSGYFAACAGVWLHGEAGRRFGPGLIAEDLPELLPAIWSELNRA